MNELQQALQRSVVRVVFQKKDGTIREMYCTTSREFIPVEMLPSGEYSAKLSNLVQRVYDVEVDGWRSFRNDSVIMWEETAAEAA